MERLIRLSAVIAAVFSLTVHTAFAAQTTVAVAANFTDAAKEIAAAYKAKTGNDAVLSFGASGQFYTQITQGAPFEVFLSADDERPKKAIAEGFGVEGTAFTYAIGKPVAPGSFTLGVCRQRDQGHHPLQALEDLRLADYRFGRPRPVFAQRHELDKAQDDPFATGELSERFHLVVIEATH